MARSGPLAGSVQLESRKTAREGPAGSSDRRGRRVHLFWQCHSAVTVTGRTGNFFGTNAKKCHPPTSTHFELRKSGSGVARCDNDRFGPHSGNGHFPVLAEKRLLVPVSGTGIVGIGQKTIAVHLELQKSARKKAIYGKKCPK